MTVQTYIKEQGYTGFAQYDYELDLIDTHNQYSLFNLFVTSKPILTLLLLVILGPVHMQSGEKFESPEAE